MRPKETDGAYRHPVARSSPSFELTEHAPLGGACEPIQTLNAGVETCERRSATMRTKLNATRRRIVAAGLALAIAVAISAAHVTYADTSPTPPVSQCTDFACQP